MQRDSIVLPIVPQTSVPNNSSPLHAANLLTKSGSGIRVLLNTRLYKATSSCLEWACEVNKQNLEMMNRGDFLRCMAVLLKEFHKRPRKWDTNILFYPARHVFLVGNALG